MDGAPDVHTIENFFGVYLLYCKNPKYFGKTYIGYTVNPNRRLKQHNKGKKAGGAWRTSQKGPWEMVIIIHGFPNDIAALRFEWAWQNPYRSRRLNHVTQTRKKSKEQNLDYCFRILSEMLRVGPWNRLPLTIRWLNQEYCREFSIEKTPPYHMPVSYGPVISKKLAKNSQLSQSTSGTTPCVNYCSICQLSFGDDSRKLTCLVSQCDLLSHVVCLAKYFLLEKGEFIPVRGACPKCHTECLWGDIVRKSQGCYGDVNLEINMGDAEAFYESESE